MDWFLGQQFWFCLTRERICCQKPWARAKQNCCSPRTQSITVYMCQNIINQYVYNYTFFKRFKSRLAIGSNYITPLDFIGQVFSDNQPLNYVVGDTISSSVYCVKKQIYVKHNDVIGLQPFSFVVLFYMTHSFLPPSENNNKYSHLQNLLQTYNTEQVHIIYLREREREMLSES